MPVDPAYQAWLDGEWNAGRLTRPDIALQSLRNNPRQFLRKYPLQNTFDPQNSGVAQVYIANNVGGGHRPGSTLRTRRMHTTEAFNIQPGPGQLGEGYLFSVHGLHTGRSSMAPVWYQLDNTGPNIMLTAKLTGCTFVARAVVGHPGWVEVTHLQPDQETGIELNQRMNTVGQHAYGRLRYDFDVRSINVVGVRVGLRWKIYAQKLEKANLTIRSVHRIYPP